MEVCWRRVSGMEGCGRRASGRASGIGREDGRLGGRTEGRKEGRILSLSLSLLVCLVVFVCRWSSDGFSALEVLMVGGWAGQELDAATELDGGDPLDLGQKVRVCL